MGGNFDSYKKIWVGEVREGGKKGNDYGYQRKVSENVMFLKFGKMNMIRSARKY